MERPLEQIYQSLQKLIGFHRQLMETVRQEHEALVSASVKDIQEAVLAKQALIEAITQAESERIRAAGELAVTWKKPARELTLNSIILEVQGREPKAAEQFRTALNALTILIKRVTESNEANRLLVERSLEHVQDMKKNVLGEARPRTDTYTQKGKKQSRTGAGSRLLSTEI